MVSVEEKVLALRDLEQLIRKPLLLLLSKLFALFVRFKFCLVEERSYIIILSLHTKKGTVIVLLSTYCGDH